MSDLTKLLTRKKKHKKKHGVGHEVLDEVGDGCCLGDLLGCSTIGLATLAVVGAGIFAGAKKLRTSRD